jgi:hypothetical protein
MEFVQKCLRIGSGFEFGKCCEKLDLSGRISSCTCHNKWNRRCDNTGDLLLLFFFKLLQSVIQEVFVSDGNTSTKWYVPITYATSNGDNFTNTTTKLWLTPNHKELKLPIKINQSDWIILNNRQIGTDELPVSLNNIVLTLRVLPSQVRRQFIKENSSSTGRAFKR